MFIISACSDDLNFCKIGNLKHSPSKQVCSSKKYLYSTWWKSGAGCRALFYCLHLSTRDLGCNAWAMGFGSRPQRVSGDGPVILTVVQKRCVFEMLFCTQLIMSGTGWNLPSNIQIFSSVTLFSSKKLLRNSLKNNWQPGIYSSQLWCCLYPEYKSEFLFVAIILLCLDYWIISPIN